MDATINPQVWPFPEFISSIVNVKMKSKEQGQSQKKHPSNDTHDKSNHHTVKQLTERPFDFLWLSIKATFMVYIICTIIVAIVLVYCGISIYYAPLLTLGLVFGLFIIGNG